MVTLFFLVIFTISHVVTPHYCGRLLQQVSHLDLGVSFEVFGSAVRASQSTDGGLKEIPVLTVKNVCTTEVIPARLFPVL